jgi:microcystin-dependent protein
MADAFIGEIRLLPFNFAPEGWLACNGQQLLINQYAALASVIGGLYGQLTQTQFYLPDLRGRAPMGLSTSYPAGTGQGSNSVTLNAIQVPAHNHLVVGNVYPSTSNTPAPTTRFGTDSSNTFATYKAPPNTQPTTMNPATISPVGQNLPHENRQPYLALQFCICYDGFYPSKP